MSATLLLIHVVGTVALMLWGMRMVRTGVERAFGGRLATLLTRCFSRRMAAFGSGLFVSLALQSSTATAVFVNGFVTRGAVTTLAGLAAVLGADVGTTLVATVLSLDLSALSPFLVAVGFVVHASASQGVVRQLARATLGLGVVLLALGLLRAHSAALADSEVLPVVLASLADEPVIAVLIFAIVTWLLHSSLAAVLLAAALAGAGIVETPLAVLLVLGANLGAGLPALGMSAGQGAVARRVPLGNVLFRAVGVVCLLPIADELAPRLAALPGSAAAQVVAVHVAFNVLVAAVFLPLLTPVAGWMDRRLRDSDRNGVDEGAARLLDAGFLNDTDAALSAAARETVRLADLVESMLRDVIVALCDNDRSLAKEIAARDDAVDRLHREIKLFVTRATRGEMSEAQSRRATQILTFVTDLEHIADIVEGIAGHARRKAVRGLDFSDAGVSDLRQLHEQVLRTMHAAVDVFMSGGADSAQKLIDEKRRVGRMERTLERAHLNRLREGRQESIETSAFHQDILRDLKRIHSHLVAVAYATIGAPADAESPGGA